MTTTNYKKRKKKNFTDNQLKKLEQEWRAYNKQMRKQHCHAAQFDSLEDYIAYTRGEYKPQKSVSNNTYKPQESVRRETVDYPSLSNNVAGFAPKKEPTKYTGDYIIGIATTHKSNLVPVTSKKQAVEASQMRRN
jgi:hypothetical protein